MSISSERVKEWRDRSKQRMIDAMGGKCQCCGYDKCNDALAFHHIDPKEKELSFGGLRASPRSWNIVVNELKKSILVCHNCHSEIHAGFRTIPDDYTKFDETFSDYRKIGRYDICPMCSGEKLVKNKFCSHTCAAKNSGKVDWDNLDLPTLKQTMTNTQIADMLDVSETAVRKRLLKLSKLVDIV